MMVMITTVQQQILKKVKTIRVMLTTGKDTDEEVMELPTSQSLSSNMELQPLEEDWKDKTKKKGGGMYNTLCLYCFLRRILKLEPLKLK